MEMDRPDMQTPDDAVARYSFLFPIGESRRSSPSQTVSPNHSGHVRQSHPAVGRPALAATRSPPAFRAQWPMLLLPIRCHPRVSRVRVGRPRCCACRCMKSAPHPSSQQLLCTFAFVESCSLFHQSFSHGLSCCYGTCSLACPDHPHPETCPLRFGTVPGAWLSKYHAVAVHVPLLYPPGASCASSTRFELSSACLHFMLIDCSC